MKVAASSFPAAIYSETVLRHVFADAQRSFLPSLLEIDLAHVLMLTEQGILSREQGAQCLRGVLALDRQLLQNARYDGSVEDLFFFVERQLEQAIGTELAGRIHTARSRNDLDMTMYRMVLRLSLLEQIEVNVGLRAVLLRLAEEHHDALMPAYTHNQPAQPTTLGHLLMAYVEVLERDTERLRACYARVNRSPLGACAITTTGFPIDRESTARRLGFRGLVLNSYGAIAAVDYLTEACSTLAVAMLSLGRFTQEMLLWSTAEFGFLRLSDGYVQVSSIMPQKRNPVPLEHVRVLASRAMTEAQAVLGTLHNTPFADMNDSEDSLQPLLALAFADARRAGLLLAGALDEATFNVERMDQRSRTSFLTVTEVADTLVRRCGCGFHDAHALVSAVVRQAATDDTGKLAEELHTAVVAKQMPISLEELREALDPRHFVDVRQIPGGPAAAVLGPAIARSEEVHAADQAWSEAERRHLGGCAETLLREASEIAATATS